MDALDWLDAQGTPEAHAARDELEQLRAEKERMSYVCSVTRCDPKMDGNHVYLGIGGRPIKGNTLRDAIDNELVRLYGVAKMPQG